MYNKNLYVLFKQWLTVEILVHLKMAAVSSLGPSIEILSPMSATVVMRLMGQAAEAAKPMDSGQGAWQAVLVSPCTMHIITIY